MKKTRKIVSTLVAVSLVGGLVLPAAGPAFAYSKNSVSKVISIANNDDPQQTGKITIKEDEDYNDNFATGDMFTVTLPSGVKWDDDGSDDVTAYYGAIGATIEKVSDSELEITMTAGGTDAIDTISFTPWIKAKSTFEGDITVTIDNKDSAVTKQDLVIARALDGDTVTTVADVETIGDVGQGGQITVEESSKGSLSGVTEIKFKLPADFDWNAYNSGSYPTLVAFSGSFDDAKIKADDDFKVSINDRTLTLTFDADQRVVGSSQRGYLRLTPGISADDADYGDVEINVSGDADDADVIVAKYADYGVDASIDEVKDVISGRFEEETGEVTLEESVAGTFIQGRKLELTFPTWVKVTKLNVTDGSDFKISDSNVEIDDNEVDITIGQETSGTDGGTLKFEMDLSVEAGKSGDIEMTIGGKSGATGSLVVAKAIAPVTIEGTKSNLKIGAKAQPLGDIIISENIDGAIQEDALGVKDSASEKDAVLKVELPDNVEWNDYTVEVIEGNLEIDEDDVDTGDTDNILVIPIKSESSKASKIKISGITVDIDRTVPEGEVTAKVKGNAVAENVKAAYGWVNDGPERTETTPVVYTGSDSSVDDGEFDSSTAASAVVGNVVTPAPEAGTATFNIGSTIYTAGGVTKVMDAAPYIKDGRTYVPVRYLALALGVAENDIAFENGVVTLTKGTDVVKLTIGSTTLMNNDTTVTMDVAPEVVNGRTMLPARFVAEALGAVVGFANGQVVISY